MGMAEMRRDIEFLAGNLTHRGASTESERTAAEYIRERFCVHTPNTEIDDFFAIESPWLLFASYYGEFLIVALLAFWQPWFAFGYGAVVSALRSARAHADTSDSRVGARGPGRVSSCHGLAEGFASKPPKDAASRGLLGCPSVQTYGGGFRNGCATAATARNHSILW